jgi:hypothetical protein
MNCDRLAADEAEVHGCSLSNLTLIPSMQQGKQALPDVDGAKLSRRDVSQNATHPFVHSSLIATSSHSIVVEPTCMLVQVQAAQRAELAALK